MPVIRAELDELKELSAKEGRQTQGRFLLEGWRALAEAVHAGALPETVLIDPQRLGTPEARKTLALLEERSIAVREATDRQLQKLSATENSPGVVAALRMARHSIDDALGRGGLAIALDEVADPGNLGAILRTAAWFGASGVLLGKGCVELHNEKAVRATAGALFHLRIAEKVALAPTLVQARVNGFRLIVAAGEGGLPLPQLAPSPRDLVVFGGEARGVTAAVREVALEIGLHGLSSGSDVPRAIGALRAEQEQHPLAIRCYRDRDCARFVERRQRLAGSIRIRRHPRDANR